MSPSYGRSPWRACVGVAFVVTFIALHLPHLPRSLEDLDSINFALALRRFDVAHHQPHPPGYPVYVALGRLAAAMAGSEARALGIISVMAGAIGGIAGLSFFAAVGRGGATEDWRVAAGAVALAATAPLYWLSAVRPLSDMAGLAAALVVLAVALHPRRLVLAAFLAGVAAGVRSQVLWLTLPFLALSIWRASATAVADGTPAARRRPGRLLRPAAAALAIGLLTWAIPLVLLSGGLRAYWHAFFDQASEDLSGVAMLWTTPTPRQAAIALQSAFIAPWALPATAVLVAALAAAGLGALVRRDRTALATIGATFGPYLLFDLLFQESVTTRYALPLVPPMAYLAARGAARLPSAAGLAVVACLVGWNLFVGIESAAAYARAPAPAFRMLADMAAAARASSAPATLAMDRRLDLDLRRPIRWIGDRVPGVGARLPAPPRREWLELVKYWNDPATAPDATVWFVADPRRDYLALVQHDPPLTYEWGLPYPILLGGIRPDAMQWYTIRRPEWYLGRGWSLTPESNGTARLDGQGLEHGPIEGWVSRAVFGRGVLMIGGRNLTEPPAHVRLRIEAGGEPVADFDAPPGPFLQLVPLNPTRPPAFSPAGYARLTVRAVPAADVAVEQFDASASRPLLGFGPGWHEYEHNAAAPLRWRWLSERGELLVHAPRGAVLHLEGESPRKYFSRPSRLHVRLGGRVLADLRLSSDFSLTIPLPTEVMGRGNATIVLETDQIFVPADRSRRTRDRRRLGLRFFSWDVRNAQN